MAYLKRLKYELFDDEPEVKEEFFEPTSFEQNETRCTHCGMNNPSLYDTPVGSLCSNCRVKYTIQVITIDKQCMWCYKQGENILLNITRNGIDYMICRDCKYRISQPKCIYCDNLRRDGLRACIHCLNKRKDIYGCTSCGRYNTKLYFLTQWHIRNYGLDPLAIYCGECVKPFLNEVSIEPFEKKIEQRIP